MRQFIDRMRSDYDSEHYTKKEWVIYGIVAPSVMLVVCGLLEGLLS